jgi:hypothetical protein
MILENGVLTFTADETIEEDQEMSGSSEMTIGSNIDTTNDADYLSIKIKLFLSQTEWKALRAIIFDYTKEIYYTPSRILSGKEAADPMKIVIDGPPSLNKIMKNVRDEDEIGYEVGLKFVESRY